LPSAIGNPHSPATVPPSGGARPYAGEKLLFNVGFHRSADGLWVGWVGTKAALYDVDKAGELLLER
jgi:hypothetical protein